MERKNEIKAILGRQDTETRSTKGSALLIAGVLLGVSTTGGALALYYSGYKQGLTAAAPEQEAAPLPSELLELPPPFEAREATDRTPDKHPLQRL